MPKAWNEIEIRSTIQEYFQLLDLESKGKPYVKKVVYERLHKKYPVRTTKSFEFKFQNISAILFEQQHQYLSGLKPKFNYQKLLRWITIDELDKEKVQKQEPWQILSSKLTEINSKGLIKVDGKGTGKFGLALEKALGIEQNSSKTADFMGIELKTKTDKTLQTLFSRIPSRYLNQSDKKSFFRANCYHDPKRNRKALYTSINASGDSLGFKLKATEKTIVIERNGLEILEYDKKYIEQALLSKHSQTFFIMVNPVKESTSLKMKLDKVTYCKWPSIINFSELVELGEINLDFTLSLNDDKLKDHGFLWRIKPDSIDKLYLFNEEILIK